MVGSPVNWMYLTILVSYKLVTIIFACPLDTLAIYGTIISGRCTRILLFLINCMWGNNIVAVCIIYRYRLKDCGVAK